MKLLLITFLCSLFIFSCGNKGNSENTEQENIKSQIIQSLNKGEPDLALELSQEGTRRQPDDLELYYFQAQAYSLKANIDIYSLFPIVEIELFDVAITEWNQQSEYEKKRRQATTLSLTGPHDRSNLEELKTLALEIEKLDPEDIENIRLENIEFAEIYAPFPSDTDTKLCRIKFDVTSSFYNNLTIENMSKDYQILDDRPCDQETVSEFVDTINLSEFGVSFKYIATYRINKKIDNIKKQKETERLLKISMTLLDSIPMMRKVPLISEEEIVYLHKALDILEKVTGNEEASARIQNNALSHTGLLGGYLIIYSIKDSINLDEVKGALDFACKVSPEKLITNYRNLYLGFGHLLKVSLKTKLYTKNKKNIDNVIELYNQAPDFLNEKQEEEFINSISDYQSDNC